MKFLFIYLFICKTHSRTPWQNRSISRLTETKKTKNSKWHICKNRSSLLFPLEGELLFFNIIILSCTQSIIALLSLRQTSHSRLIFAFVTFQTTTSRNHLSLSGMLGTIIGQVTRSVYLRNAGNNPKDRYEPSVSLRNSGNHPRTGRYHF